MSDPTEIYLQPECCADEYVGRLWCEHDAPVDCEDGVPWTKYVRADIAEADLAAARATNLKLRQYAKHYPECPMWGATGDEVCNCGLSGAMMETDKSSDPGVSDPNSVICPNCCSQFQATPVNVQEELARLRGELEQARLLFNKEFNENNESRRRLKAELAAARALLREIEWDVNGKCPVCTGWKMPEGEMRGRHTDNCPLRAAIAGKRKP